MFRRTHNRRLAGLLVTVAVCATAIAGTVGTAADAASARCELPTRNTLKGLYRVAITACPSQIPVDSRTFWTVRVTTRAGAPVRGRVDVTGGMPEHGHGFLTPPVVVRTAPGVYRAQLVFAMPGRWVIEFRVVRNGRRDVVRYQVVA